MEMWDISVAPDNEEIQRLKELADALYDACQLCEGMCLKNSAEDVCPGVVKCMRCEVYSSDLSMIRCPCCDGCMIFLQEVSDV